MHVLLPIHISDNATVMHCQQLSMGLRCSPECGVSVREYHGTDKVLRAHVQCMYTGTFPGKALSQYENVSQDRCFLFTGSVTIKE